MEREAEFPSHGILEFYWLLFLVVRGRGRSYNCRISLGIRLLFCSFFFSGSPFSGSFFFGSSLFSGNFFFRCLLLRCQLLFCCLLLRRRFFFCRLQLFFHLFFLLYEQLFKFGKPFLLIFSLRTWRL